MNWEIVLGVNVVALWFIVFVQRWWMAGHAERLDELGDQVDAVAGEVVRTPSTVYRIAPGQLET